MLVLNISGPDYSGFRIHMAGGQFIAGSFSLPKTAPGRQAVLPIEFPPSPAGREGLTFTMADKDAVAAEWNRGNSVLKANLKRCVAAD